MKILPKGIIEKCTRTVGDRNEIDEIMHFTLILQSAFGNQILNPNWTWKKSFPYQLATGLLIVYVTFGTLDIVNNTNDVKLIAEAAYTGVITACIPSRLYLFLIARKDFQNLYIILKTTLFMSIKNDSEEKMKDVLRKMKIGVYCMQIFMTVLPIFIYLITALWHYVNGEMVTMSRTTSILMPMRSPYYEIGLLLHIVFMFEAAFTIMLTDMWFLVIMIFFCTSSDSTVKILNVKKNLLESQSEYSSRLSNSLRKFYIAHITEVKFLYKLNGMFKWLGLLPLISMALCICLILVTMSKGVDLKFVSNIVPTMVELFVYNWFGEQIKNKAENWRTALLEFDWLNLTPKDKKRYYIMLCYLQKNFGIKTAIGTDLSLLTMTNSLKFSYQAFTVLQSVDV